MITTTLTMKMKKLPIRKHLDRLYCALLRLRTNKLRLENHSRSNNLQLLRSPDPSLFNQVPAMPTSKMRAHLYFASL